MPIKKFSILLLLLTFLSGTFSLGRLNIGIAIEARLIFFIMFVLLVLLGLKKGSEINKDIIKGKLGLFLLVLFSYVFMSAISMLYAFDQDRALEKFYLITFLSLIVLAVLFIVNETSPRDFFNIITMFFVIVSIIYTIPIILDVFSGAERGDSNLSGPNVVTRILFFGVCASLYRFSITNKNIYFLLSALFLVGIVLVGSRGGLIGVLVTFSVLFIMKKVLSPWKIKKTFSLTYKKLLLFPLGAGMIYFMYEPVKKVFLNRIIGVTFSGDKVYTAGRDAIYDAARSMIKEKPYLGHGLDSFTPYTGYVYPHNLLLEMMVEIGLMGSVFFGFICIFSILVIFKLKSSPLFILSGIPLYMIVVQMLSGEFYDFRYYYLWVVPFLYYGAVGKTDLINQTLIKKKKNKGKKEI